MFSQTGRSLYEEFTMVVTLKEQIRVVDPIWIDIFRHLRHEQVEPRHIKTLEELCPTNPLSPATDFSQKPWNSAVLVTPRHTIRTEWNRHALRKHCVDNNHQLFVVPRTGCRSLNSAEVDALLARISNSKTENNELPVTLELAIGMPVLVTQNLHTELDMTNGARSVVVEIVLNRAEAIPSRSQPIVQLLYPPSFVLVKMNHSCAPRFGLES